MDEQHIQQQNPAKPQPLRAQVVQTNAATEQRKPTVQSRPAMLVNVIPRDEDMPGFVRGYN